MRTFLALALALLLTMTLAPAPAQAAGGPGTPFSSSDSASNIPAGCSTQFNDGCYHMRQGLNGLDSPKIDVLILAPASPYAERDLRAMTAAVEMWESGFLQLASQRGWDWMADGVEFHISSDIIAPAYGASGEFTTYPFYDPEIVVIAANPVVAGVQGIGIDAHDTAGVVGLDFFFGGQTPCHGAPNPFDIESWEAVPGFDSHHDGRGGTYVEDCGGEGGNVCFAINLAIDPVPGVFDDVLGMNMFDLVGHEVGHCLTLGHVGDAGDHKTTAWPRDDVMSYTHDAGISGRKCASTLDLETFATTMSWYLDVNGDGLVDASDRLFANDHVGDLDTSAAGNPMQVQHPSTHRYASPTGLASDCPFPDTGLVPGMTLGGGTPDAELRSGEPRDVAVSMGDDLLFYIDVPAGATRLTTQMHAKCVAVYAGACTVDADLYTRLGQAPNDSDYDCRPYATMTDEVCDKTNPAPGRWFVRLYGFAGTGTVTLTSTLGGPADLDGDGTPDGQDHDRDGDGVPNDVETALGTDPDDGEPTAVAGTVCLPSPTSIRQRDEDRDHLPALYGVGGGPSVGADGSIGEWEGSCWLAGDPDDDGASRLPEAPVAASVCLANANSKPTRADLDGDGVEAIYLRGAKQLGSDGALGPAPAYCWIGGDPDDDGVQRV